MSVSILMYTNDCHKSFCMIALLCGISLGSSAGEKALQFGKLEKKPAKENGFADIIMQFM